MQRINLSANSVTSSFRANNCTQCIHYVQRRYKHGRDFPRNLPRPPPPSGTPVFSTPSMTLHHNPPPSAPSYKVTPTSFLPETHRQRLFPVLHPAGTLLPPPLTTHRKREKTYHLAEQDLAKMRKLRNHPDPEQRKSRNEIAKMFGCSQLFVGMAAPLSKAEVKEVFKQREEQRESWGVRKRFFRDNRQRRRQEWTHSEE